jgi:hypothetical protein
MPRVAPGYRNRNDGLPDPRVSAFGRTLRKSGWLVAVARRGQFLSGPDGIPGRRVPLPADPRFRHVLSVTRRAHRRVQRVGTSGFRHEDVSLLASPVRVVRRRAGGGANGYGCRYRDRRSHRATDRRRVGLRGAPVGSRRDRRRRPLHARDPSRPTDDRGVSDRLCAAAHRHRRRGGASGPDDPAVGRGWRVHRTCDGLGYARSRIRLGAWKHIALRPRARNPARRGSRRSAARDADAAVGHGDRRLPQRVRGPAQPFRYVGLVVDGGSDPVSAASLNGVTDVDPSR